MLVQPKPRADALVVGARGHICRDLEVRVHVPHACLIHAEYDEVVRLYFRGF